MTTLYLSGPMTGLPDNNYPAFHQAAAALRAAGYTVLNPAENTPPNDNPDWSDWMRVAIRQMLDADALAILPGWSKSSGALAEACIARVLHMSRDSVVGWLGTVDV